MNISLLDERSSVCRYYRPRYGSLQYICVLRRGVVWLGRHLWRKSFMKIAACCTAPSSSSASMSSYHRLRRSSSMDGLMANFECSCPPRKSETSVLGSNSPFDLGISYGEDTVLVKVGIIGDCQTGKTSLMENYVVGDKSSTEALEETVGVNSMDKVLDIQTAKIALSIWELGGYKQFMAPVVCNDAAAILILFDLTRRTTLHSVKQWFIIARQCNQVAVPVLVGTKFDQFVKMPQGIRSLITKQARLYAQAMGAPLLFTSIPYNINVNKVFKIVLARIFDLPCNISRNLNPGEPVVEY